MQKPDVELKFILYQFVARFTGNLWDWFASKNEYSQLQFVNSSTIIQAISRLDVEFMGNMTNV